MGFKDLFVKTDALEEVAVQETKKQKGGYTAPNNVSSLTATPSQFSAPTISPEEKNEFTEFLDEVYKKGNFPGPDFQEYTDAIKAMDSLPMDEKTKYTAVFAGFKVQGVTKSKLLDTGGKYITMINEQTAGFAKQIDEILKTEVAQKQKNLDAILKENTEIEKQMIALTEKKNKNNEALSATSAEIAAQVTSLNVKKSSFESAAADFIGRVQSNIKKINEYLPA